MKPSNFTEIHGFAELNEKLKKLDDNVKRREVLKIQRRLAKPIAEAFSRHLPKGTEKHKRYVKGGAETVYAPGNLKRSVRIKTVSKRRADSNPMIQILPDKKGKNDGYYRFMVVKKGFKGKGRNSRTGANIVVPEARNKTLRETQGRTTEEAEKKTAEYIQKQIYRLSNV